MRILFLMIIAFAGASCTWAQAQPEPRLSAPAELSLWEDEGFRQGAHELTLNAGAGLGMRVITSPRPHDWALAMLDFGWMLSPVEAPEKWYRGNWEILAELFGGE